MSKRSKTRHSQSNPTYEKNKRRKRIRKAGLTVYQEAAASGRFTKQSKRRHAELQRLHGLV